MIDPDVGSTRDAWGFLHTVTFADDGRRYACEVDGGPISAGAPALPTPARWRVAVDGRDLGTLFDAEPDGSSGDADADTPDNVRARVLAAVAAGEGRAT